MLCERRSRKGNQSMLGMAIAGLLVSAGTSWMIGAAVVARRDSFLRTKRGVFLLVVMALSFVVLPPQITAFDQLSGSLQGLLPGLVWPDTLEKGTYLGLWALSSVAALFVGMRIWQAGKPGWREGASLSDASGRSRVSSMLPLTDTLPAVLDVLVQARLTERDLAYVAEDVRSAGRRLAATLPPSDGALYSAAAAKLPPAIAGALTGYLLEGAGRRSHS